MTDAAITNINEADLSVVLTQRLAQVDFRDDANGTTLWLYVKSTHTVGVPGIQRAATLEIISDTRLPGGEQIRISKTLSAMDRDRIDRAVGMVLHEIGCFRPAFPRPLSEFSCNAAEDVAVGAAQKYGGEWICFVELVDSGRTLRCLLGDQECLGNFRASLRQIENF